MIASGMVEMSWPSNILRTYNPYFLCTRYFYGILNVWDTTSGPESEQFGGSVTPAFIYRRCLFRMSMSSWSSLILNLCAFSAVLVVNCQGDSWVRLLTSSFRILSIWLCSVRCWHGRKVTFSRRRLWSCYCALYFILHPLVPVAGWLSRYCDWDAWCITGESWFDSHHGQEIYFLQNVQACFGAFPSLYWMGTGGISLPG